MAASELGELKGMCRSFSQELGCVFFEDDETDVGERPDHRCPGLKTSPLPLQTKQKGLFSGPLACLLVTHSHKPPFFGLDPSTGQLGPFDLSHTEPKKGSWFRGALRLAPLVIPSFALQPPPRRTVPRGERRRTSIQQLRVRHVRQQWF